MTGWREVAERAARGENVAPPVQGFEVVEGSAAGAMPAWLAGEVRSLRQKRAPRLRDRTAWRPIVEDAEMLLARGWAEQALALGWHPLELFGCGLRGDDRMRSVKTLQVGLSLAEPGQAAWASA